MEQKSLGMPKPISRAASNQFIVIRDGQEMAKVPEKPIANSAAHYFNQ